jgi:5-oxopent-3-ene-1,2,5-tricarboxylate decarboxylase / 2-hydroxyhepta-2,4-diene-1,7-dioate isomerase
LAKTCTIAFDTAPFYLSGAVYGALVNHRTALAELGDDIARPPYNAAPRAPVLYIKPRNTLAAAGDAVEIPAGTAELEIGACLGLVIGRLACNVSVTAALDHVAGYVIVNDVSVPHQNFYRPSIRFKARDGFCPLGPAVVARDKIADPDALSIRTYVDGTLVQVAHTEELVRSTAVLLADVSEFMTLAPGDVLAVGVARPSPRVRAGQTVDIVIDGLGTLSNRFVAAAA